MVMSAGASDMKDEIVPGNVTETSNCELATVSTVFDDDIICLDSDEAPSSPPKQDPTTDRSKISRLLLQVIRLHLSERCASPGCSAIMDQAGKLGKKVEAMEALATKLRKTCYSQELEITRLNEEMAKNRQRLSLMEGVVKRQGALIRDLEAQLSSLLTLPARPSQSAHSNNQYQKPASSSPLIIRSMNAVRAEQTPIVQRRAHSDANLASMNGGPPSSKGSRFYADRKSTGNSREIGNPVRGMQSPAVSSPTACKTLNVCNPRNGRIQLEVPFVAGKLLVDFTSPIGTPVLDYPAECHHCKVAGPIDLTLEIKTEPLNFLLTKKVQGVVKYNAFNGCRPKNVKMFCYLESAIKVRRWTSSLVHTFADSDKIKFDIVFSKDQQVARFDRIVAFAFASTGIEKFVTNRVVFNIGQQAELSKGRTTDLQPVCTQVLHTSTVEPMEMGSSQICVYCLETYTLVRSC
ncbi:hypothetical protein Y032_0006g2872 [Ancylostoma ceylanicum]|nr:hypothetical protein Y032_0006g2872 [Ancylostoma ceylanicum]